MLTKKSYSKKLSWNINTNLKNLPIDESYHEIFNELYKDKRFSIIENTIKKYITTNNLDLLEDIKNILSNFSLVRRNCVKIINRHIFKQSKKP